jgi:hypothetical protein
MAVSPRPVCSIGCSMRGLSNLSLCGIAFFIASLLTAFLVTDLAHAKPCATCTVKNTGIEVTVSCTSTSITLTQIYGVKNSQNYLNSTPPTPLLSYADTNSNSYGSSFKGVSCDESSNTVSISANSSDSLLSFVITLSPDTASSGGNVVLVNTQVICQGFPNLCAAPTTFFKAMLPSVQSFNIPNSPVLPGNVIAMVPQMVGGVLPLSNISKGLGPGAPGTFGSPATTFGLPTNLNVLEIAEVYDGSGKGGGGLFFADLTGDYGQNLAPLQFILTNLSPTQSPTGPYQIAGYWTALLKYNEPTTLPSLAIGVHPSGDWHNAVDYYVSKRSTAWTFPDTPKWFREAGGIYFVGVAGGGSFFNTFPFTTLGDTYFGVQLFDCNSTLTDGSGDVTTTGTPPNPPGQRCLLDVYNDAQALGTNVIYLGEWWSQNDSQGNWGYGNIGDWIVAPSLGGAAGLKKAVDAIHGQTLPGKVILYLDPYFVDDSSTVAMTEVPNWQLLLGPPIPITAPACNNCANTDIANTQWQDYLIQRAVDLVTYTDVDGFFLDSWGWQMNWPAHSSAEDVNTTSQQWSAAALRFVDRLRAAIRAVPGHADAIVMGENNTGPLPFHWDGGSAADLSPWNTSLFAEDQGKLLASPIRYAMPNANFFVNGSNLGGLNQVFAAGHSLALGPFWLLDVMNVPPANAPESCSQGKPAGCYSAFAPYGPYFAGHAATTFVAPQLMLTTSNDSPSATVPSTTGLAVNQYITAASVPYGTTITAISGTSGISMSQNATASTSVQASFSEYPIPTADTAISSYVKSLINIRQTYADALVYGTQLPMPTTSSSAVVAYMYQGQANQILTVVNNGGAEVGSVTVTLDSSYGTGQWTQVLPSTSTPGISEASDGTVVLTGILPAPTPPPASGTVPQIGGLVVLQRSCPTSAGCSAPQTYGTTPTLPLMNEPFVTAIGYPTMSNWTDWMVSGSKSAPSHRWTVLEESSLTTYVTTSFLQVQSPKGSSLLFYDSFDGGDFTYSGGVTIDSFATTAAPGQAGLSFRLSDNELNLDAGNQGYDAVLTNQGGYIGSIGGLYRSGSVQLLKRQPSTGSSPVPVVKLLCPPALVDVSPGQTYQLSVTASNNWVTGTTFPAPDPKDSNDNAYPAYPSSATFKVSIGGVQYLSCTDESPYYFSGRFGVNASNANAHFTCLQANDGTMPPPCPPITSISPPTTPPRIGPVPPP